jgi:hypothetical protein
MVERTPAELIEKPSTALVEGSAAYKKVLAAFTAMLKPLLPVELALPANEPLLMSMSKVSIAPPRPAA